MQALLDREAIRELRARFSQALDSSDWVLLASLLEEEIAIDYAAFGVVATSATRDEFIGFFRTWYRREGLQKQHLLTNMVITLHGDTATAQSELLGQYLLPNAGGGTEFTARARYEDEFVRTGAGWRFKAIRVYTRFITGDPSIAS